MLKGLTIEDFRKRFQNEEDCLNYLIEKKWGNGFTCVKCQCKEFHKGRKWYYRRCKNCGYDESATANTLFHKCKLGLLVAFEMAYRLSVKKKGMSSVELAREFGCQQSSAWLMKAKYQHAMKSSGKHPLKGDVDVDEFLVGGFDENEPGRSLVSKQLVVLGVEKVTNKKGKVTIGRAYAKVVDDASAEQLRTFFEEKISKETNVKSDGWKSYIPLKKDWEITQIVSKKGEGFPELHIHIMNIKNWIRGTHHKFKGPKLQQYLDEYHFRFNRRGFLDTILDKLLERSVSMKPIPYGNMIVAN